MTRVVLDTTAFYPWETVRRLELERLFAGGRDGDIELLVPEVVVREVVRHHRRGIRRTSRELRTAWEAAQAFAALPPSASGPFVLPDREALEATFEKELRDEIDAAGRILPAPKVDGGRLLDRALQGTKPAAQEKESLRDQLIWETLLVELGLDDAENLVFVTANTRDFTDSSGALHEDLVAELKADGLREDAVIVEGKVGVIADRLLPTSDEVSRAIDSAIEKGAERLLDLVRADLHDRAVDSVSWPWESRIDEAFMSSIDEVYDPVVTAILDRDGGAMDVEVEVQVDAAVEFISLTPSTWDVDALEGSSALSNVTSDAPIIQTTDSRTLRARVQARWLLAREDWADEVETLWVEEPDELRSDA